MKRYVDYNSKYLDPMKLSSRYYKRILECQGCTVFTLRGVGGYYFRIQKGM